MQTTGHQPRTRHARAHATSATPPQRPVTSRLTATATAALLTLALAACGAPSGPTDPGGPGTLTTYLLLDNWTARSVSVMSSEGGSADLAFQSNVLLGLDVTPCGMAIGPDGRVYVTDHQGVRVLVIDRERLLDGTATGDARLAAIELEGLVQPCGVAFDASGAMWVADRRGATNTASQPNWLAQFDAAQVAAASGSVSLAPVRTLQPVHNTTSIMLDTLFASWWITSLTFDDQDRLWYTDRWRWTVSRIDDPNGYGTGLVTDVEPDMQLTNAPVVGENPAVQFMVNPHSLAFDGAGNVYIGTNGAPNALRYAVDDLPSNGRTFVLPAATLTLPIPQGDGPFGPLAVTIDEDGTLLAAANQARQLFRVTAPATRDGDVTPDAVTTWADAGATDGATFVWTTRPTP